MTLSEAIIPYTDAYGLVHDRPGRLSGNGLCYLAETLIQLKLGGELTVDHEHAALQAVFACRVESGLYRRHPLPEGFMDDQESIDDYTALAVISKICRAPEIAQSILAYGRSHKFTLKTLLTNLGLRWVAWPFGWIKLGYYFPNGDGARVDFDVRAWLGRFPSLIASLQYAAGEKPALWRRIWCWISTAYCNVNNNNSARIAWMMLNVKSTPIQMNSFLNGFYERWGSFSFMYACYFASLDHPLARLSVNPGRLK